MTVTGTKRDIAGLTFEFLFAPDTEARRRCTSDPPPLLSWLSNNANRNWDARGKIPSPVR